METEVLTAVLKLLSHVEGALFAVWWLSTERGFISKEIIILIISGVRYKNLKQYC
jgi:hypothetical protein